MLGDVLARLLRKLGFNVNTRFYVNDLGRQVATLIYGTQIVESANIRKPESIKIDHWYGVIYAIVNTLLELEKLRKKLDAKIEEALKLSQNLVDILVTKSEKSEDLVEILIATKEFIEKARFVHNPYLLLKKLYIVLRLHSKKLLEDLDLTTVLKQLLDDIDEYRRTWNEYKKFLIAEKMLSTTYSKLYNCLRSAIRNYEEAENAIKNIMRRSENGDEEVLLVIRRVTQDVLEGFKETLNKLNIAFNGFDFESSKEIVALAKSIVKDVLRTKYARILEGGAIEVDLNSASQDHNYIRDLFYPDQAGRFVLQRSDGTTLYITRDIAYTLYKFKMLGASEVYNVIAVEQEREQKQVKATLYILGFKHEAENLHHFMYEMVHLKGMRMSGRRGIYYTLDELLVDMENCIIKKLLGERCTHRLDYDTVSKLAVANVRALLLTVEPGKVLSLDPAKLCENEHGIIVEYAYVRTQGILRNALNIEPLRDPQELNSKIRTLFEDLFKSNEKPSLSVEERLLVELLADFTTTLLDSYRELKPNRILEYTVKLALQFNKFYEKHPVIAERDERVKAWRLILVYATFKVLTELLDILGLPKLQRI